MASFEEAIFRVYERCVENLRDEDDGAHASSRTCKLMEGLSLSGGVVFLVALLSLHWGFVNRSGCLPGLLEAEMLSRNTTDIFPYDAILQINVDKYFVGDAPTRSSLNQVDDSLSDADGRRRQLRRLLGRSVGDALSFTQQQVERRKEYRWPTVDDLQLKRTRREYVAGRRGKSHRNLAGSDGDEAGGWGISKFLSNTLVGSSHNVNGRNHSAATTNSTVGANSTVPATNGTSDFNPLYYNVHDFEFSYDVGILELSGYMRQVHNFELINVTMQGSECLGNAYLQSLIPLGGIDTVVMNSLVATLQRGGMMINSRGDYNIWHERDVHPYSTISGWLGFKIDMLVKSLFLFFLLSTATALLVRMLISSGVVLLFPIFGLIHQMGYNVINMRLISLSYPWIGLPLEMLRGRGESTMPFLIGHTTRIVVYYTFYEATQFACSIWFYDQAQPGQRELWLFAIMMLWEYYSMIYVRAAGSIILFPRVSMALFLIYHFYLFSYPSGFHLLALLVLLFFLLWLMMYCVRKYEIEAFHRGYVTSDQPRQFYNHVPWPQWSNGLAPDYSVFMPAGRRSTSMYAMAVPPLPQMAAPLQAQQLAAGARESSGGGGSFVANSSGVEMNPMHSSVNSSASSFSSAGGAGAGSPGAYRRLDTESSHSTL